MEFQSNLKNKINNIEEVIKKFLPEEKGFQKTIFEACNYSLLAGGKRIRPLLMEEVYQLFGGTDRRDIEPFMVAIEMIHTSSLVHDDLPCMDNDEYRRGRKTTWVVYGYDMAVLTGDALLTFAFEVASKAFDTTKHPVLVGQAMKVLANKTGMFGMIGGQTVDVELTNKPVSREQLEFIYRLKTGALLEASMMIGAILAGASEEEIKEIEQIAGNIGMAFQIRDDILDLTSSTEVLGKPVLSDEKNNKTTYVTFEGMEQASKDVEDLSNDAIKAVTCLAKKHGCLEYTFLIQLIEFLITREK